MNKELKMNETDRNYRYNGGSNYYVDPAPIVNYHELSKHKKELLCKNVPHSFEHIPRKNISYMEIWETGELSEEECNENELLRAIFHRKTEWDFSGQPIGFEEMKKILKFSFGGLYKTFNGKEIRKRTYPSGGGLNSVMPYILVNSVEGFVRGDLLMFDGENNSIKLVSRGKDLHKMDDHTSLTYSKMRSFSGASAFIFFTADLKQIVPKYGLLSYRLQQLEAGHMAENLSLMLSMYGYNCVPIGGFFEDDLNSYLDITKYDQTVLYFYAIGKGQ